jgi:hypothetical protein
MQLPDGAHVALAAKRLASTVAARMRQMILDGDWRPVCPERWPGNTVGMTTLIPVLDPRRGRFAIARVHVVADRGIIGAVTAAELEARLISSAGRA